jgi:uncharacterized protein (DUF1499 family)
MSRAALYAGVTPRVPAAVRAGVVLVAVFLAALALAGLGSRWGWWGFRTGFVILRWSAYALVASVLVTILGALAARGAARRRAAALAAVAAVVGLGAVAVPWWYRRSAGGLPAIHDVTTDTENPPEFVAILPLRQGAPNSAEYGGPEIAAQQRAAYPDVEPVRLDVPPAAALARAERAARGLGWEVVAVDSADGRIEATTRTRWFGFHDDVVVRVTPEGAGSRVDVRSVSRVGKGDVGANAQRVRAFVDRLRTGA